MFLQISLIGIIHTRHFRTQYCDKKTFLGHGSLKTKVSSLKNQGMFFQSLPWLVIETCGSKLSFFAISFYRNIAMLCGKMSRVN